MKSPGIFNRADTETHDGYLVQFGPDAIRLTLLKHQVRRFVTHITLRLDKVGVLGWVCRFGKNKQYFVIINENEAIQPEKDRLQTR